MTREKYEGLRKWLMKQAAREIIVGFDELGTLVGGLPPSAEKYAAWWANELGSSTHVQCHAWLEAGYRASVTLTRREVTFTKLS